MNRVIKLRIVEIDRLYQGFQLNGFSLSPVAKPSTMYSLPFSLTSSVRVRGISISTVLIAPNSGSTDSLLGSTYLPPTIRPARGSPFSFFRTSRSVDSGSEAPLSSLFLLEGGAVEFFLEGAATEFFLEVGGTAEFRLVPTNEFALELA